MNLTLQLQRCKLKLTFQTVSIGKFYTKHQQTLVSQQPFSNNRYYTAETT